MSFITLGLFGLAGLVAVGVPVAWVVVVLRGVRLRERVLREGLRGRAIIASHAPTSMAEGDRRVLRFTVTITPDDGSAPFEATVDHAPTVMEAPGLQPGLTTSVRYLRDDDGRVVARFG